jgi:sulfite reductase (NADPH) hemoprotein beta-component
MTELSRNELLKAASAYLRGTIAEGLEAPLTGSIAEDDTQLTKFHGLYLQDDRDLRPERRKKLMEPAFAFMARVRLPGGVCTPQQWLQMDQIAGDYANGTLRLTTRQTWQFHGVIKQNLKRTMQAINRACLDTVAACGDVNRNVMASSNPHLSRAHGEAYALAKRISDHLLPKTRAYREIWLEGEKIVGEEPAEDEPIYGRTYLPRKFKTVVAVPPDNDVDVFAHDLGFVAVLDEDGGIAGWNVTIGGGMGMTHGEPATYPRTADAMAFCRPEQAVDVAEKVVLVQRDFGDRGNRKHARMKYTVEDHGVAWYRAEVEKRLGYALEDPRPMRFTHTGDRYGWTEDWQGHWHCTLFIENGRVADTPGHPIRTGLRKIAEVHKGEFRLTANQNLIIAGVKKRDRKKIEALLQEHGLTNDRSGLRLHAMACVALPTCGLALAESERYLPRLVDALDEVLDEAGLRQDEIVIRMTGCPNGCARPFLAEIGLVGRSPGTYNLYLGAAFDGTRLNKLYRQDVGHDAIVAALRPLLLAYAGERAPGERFGDFVVRTGVVAATRNGPDFHAAA